MNHRRYPFHTVVLFMLCLPALCRWLSNWLTCLICEIMWTRYVFTVPFSMSLQNYFELFICECLFIFLRAICVFGWLFVPSKFIPHRWYWLITRPVIVPSNAHAGLSCDCPFSTAYNYKIRPYLLISSQRPTCRSFSLHTHQYGCSRARSRPSCDATECSAAFEVSLGLHST